MFSALAGMIMAAKVHMTQMSYPVKKHQDSQVSELIYKSKIDKDDEKNRFLKSKLPESGYMTLEEYETKSRALTRKEISGQILDKADIVQDKNMVYVPQHKFKLVKYNEPAGSPELSLPRKLNFDRQINAQGIVSGDYTKMVYPAVYYYAEADCVSCDLYLINLDSSLNNIEKVKRANILNRDPKPLISTSKDIDRKFVFRTLTPIDFSADNTKLAVKEKIGYKHDGIWATELWVYDFDKKEAKKLTSIREAIAYYWENAENINLDEKRWDIYPMGFDANNDDRIIVNAYAYTGETPKFLGTWSIDTKGENSKLETLEAFGTPVSSVGYRLAEEDEVIPLSEIKFNAKQSKTLERNKEKQKKVDKKLENAAQKEEYKKKIHQMDMELMMKIKNREQQLKETKSKTKNTDGMIDSI